MMSTEKSDAHSFDSLPQEEKSKVEKVLFF